MEYMIYNKDCLNVLSGLQKNSVDMVFADPPFNLGKKYNKYKDIMLDSEYIVWCGEWIKECCRILKDNGNLFIHNIPLWLMYYSEILNKTDMVFRHWIVWDAPTFPMGKSLQPNHYGILWYSKSKKSKVYELRYPHKRDKSGRLIKDYGGKIGGIHPFGALVSDVWTDIHRVKHKRDKHPCQLPIHLLDRILLLSTDVNDIVLDPFMGVGTTGLSCKRLNRNFIGIDIDKEYIDIFQNKIDTESESKIGDIYIGKFRNDIITIRNDDWGLLQEYFDIPTNIKEIEYKKIVLK